MVSVVAVIIFKCRIWNIFLQYRVILEHPLEPGSKNKKMLYVFYIGLKVLTFEYSDLDLRLHIDMLLKKLLL